MCKPYLYTLELLCASFHFFTDLLSKKMCLKRKVLIHVKIPLKILMSLNVPLSSIPLCCRIDDFENLTNKLCYIHARCTRAISMVAPAYYAHLVARRARIYYLAMKEMHCHTPGCQHSHPDGSGELVKVPEVHSDMRSRMYFL